MHTAQSYTTTFTETDHELVATRMIDAPRQLVWDVHTKPEHITKWLLGPDDWAMTVCEVDLRPGGAWHWEWAGPDEETLEMNGEYLEVEPPERLVNTERWGEPWPETTNVLVLTEEDGVTTMATTITYPSHEALQNALDTGMNDGWDQSYQRLERYLATIR